MSKTTKEVNKKDKNLISKNSSNTKKTSSKTVVAKPTTSTKLATKKVVSTTSKKAKTTVSKKTASNKKSPSKKQKKVNSNLNKKNISKVDILEYYDLPYRYNQTIVKILAQTPKTLFVYWDISDDDRQKYIEQYGENFFNNTKPVLIVHNTTMDYTFEIEINDFANCWYFNINDEKCDYSVELGRRFKEDNTNNMQISNNYLYITSSNKIESPNGHILFEKNQNIVFYKNIKTNETFSKNISNIQFIKYLGKSYNAYNMYKKMYKNNEFLEGPYNPTSH